MLLFHLRDDFLKDDTTRNIPSNLAAFTTYKIIGKKCPILKKNNNIHIL